METRLEIEQARSRTRDSLSAIERRVDTLGATHVPIHLGWMRHDLRRLILELGRWRAALDHKIGVQDMKLRLARQAVERAASADGRDVDVESKLLLAQERYAALQELRLELVGAILAGEEV